MNENVHPAFKTIKKKEWKKKTLCLCFVDDYWVLWTIFETLDFFTYFSVFQLFVLERWFANTSKISDITKYTVVQRKRNMDTNRWSLHWWDKKTYSECFQTIKCWNFFFRCITWFEVKKRTKCFKYLLAQPNSTNVYLQKKQKTIALVKPFFFLIFIESFTTAI